MPVCKAAERLEKLVQNLLRRAQRLSDERKRQFMSASSSAEWPLTASRAGVTSDWQIKLFTDPKAVEDDWLRLTLEGHAGPFQTVGWASAWYTAVTRYGLAEPLILTGSRRADGRADIILPLCRYKRYGCTIISAPDRGVSDLYEPILSPALMGDEDGLQTFFQQARKTLPSHDLIFIGKLEAAPGRTHPALAPPRFLAKLPYSAWSLELGTGGADHALKQIKTKARRNVRQKINQMRRTATREVVFSDDLSGSDVLNTIWSMRAERFKAINRPDGLDQAAWRLLYEEVCQGRHNDLKPFSAVLTGNGEAVGAQLGIRHKGHFVGTLLSLKMGSYERYSPGMQVVLESVKRLARDGVTRFDLSGGDQPYKRQLGCVPRPLFELLVPSSLKGAVIWAYWRSKNNLRSHPKLFNLLKKIRQTLAPRR